MIADPIKAKRFAELAHAGKTYGEGNPYTVHLENVVSVLTRFGFTDPVMQCAGWLHDTMEDTGKSYNDIKKMFGEDTAELVYLVTDEKGRDRKEKAEKTYPHIKGRAKAIKLADRIANVEFGAANQGKNDMYRKEYPKFKDYLYIPGEFEAMWAYLDTLLREVA